MAKGDICEICGSNTNVVRSRKLNIMLCRKHSNQIYQYGKILERTIFEPNEIIVKDDCAEIILYNNKNEEVTRTLIDLEDVEKCKEYKWHLSDTGYIINRNHKKTIRLHRYLLDIANDETIIIDHVDRNKLNNKRNNLRLVSKKENCRNISLNNKNTSGIIGVRLRNDTGKWDSRIVVNNKTLALGSFREKTDAIIARLKAELEYFGSDFAPQRHLFEEYGINLITNNN